MSTFDELAIVYDNSIDWDSRLKRELPFLLESLPSSGQKRVLDMACGSGRHSVAMALEGAHVVGFDSSPKMIASARKLAETNNVTPQFRITSMEELGTAIQGKFDLVICLGNSLALLSSYDALNRTLSYVSDLLSENGVFICQVLNFKEIKTSGFRFFSSKGGQTEDGREVVFSRFFDHPADGDISTLVLSAFVKNENNWIPMVTTQPVLQVDLEILDIGLQLGQFKKIEAFSDYSKSPFAQSEHRNLIIRARL
ncbi:MAG: class I SAM-dependent methyltransferase [Candidatus Thorarchaeota archaeon]|jgi:SAM-dependent methyltransferase